MNLLYAKFLTNSYLFPLNISSISLLFIIIALLGDSLIEKLFIILLFWNIEDEIEIENDAKNVSFWEYVIIVETVEKGIVNWFKGNNEDFIDIDSFDKIEDCIDKGFVDDIKDFINNGFEVINEYWV